MKTTEIFTLEGITFIKDHTQIQMDYVDYHNVSRTIYFDVEDFKTWVTENNKLIIEEEFIDNLSKEPYCKTAVLSFDELIHDRFNESYRNLLVVEYAFLCLHISELQEYLLYRDRQFRERWNCFKETGFYKQSA